MVYQISLSFLISLFVSLSLQTYMTYIVYMYVYVCYICIEITDLQHIYIQYMYYIYAYKHVLYVSRLCLYNNFLPLIAHDSFLLSFFYHMYIYINIYIPQSNLLFSNFPVFPPLCYQYFISVRKQVRVEWRDKDHSFR